MSNIGMLNEKPLHASLKEWYAQPGDQLETAVGRYVIDIVRGDQLLEIQTGSFASIKPKLKNLLRTNPVRLIYPIALEKWIVKPDSNGGFTRRKSPKRGCIENLFDEMIRFPQLIAEQNFSLDVLMIKEEEVRRFDGRRGWRQRGWVIEERRLLEVTAQKLFKNPADWQALIPEKLEQFTVKDLAEAAGISRQLSQKCAYCLRKAGLIELAGKEGRASLYRRAAG